MTNDPTDDRFLRLERALISHHGHGVTLDTAGEIDVNVLRREMSRLGFELVACEQHGYEYAAEFRRPARRGRHAIHGTATSFSEHNAIIEAAIAALEERGMGGSRPHSTTPGFMGALAVREPA